MRLIVVCLLACLGCFQEAYSQTAPGKYWVRFTDKNGTPYSLDNPSAFLSPKSIERRLKFGLGFDELDLPVNPAYIQGVLNTGFCEVHHTSKWFNAITIFAVDSTIVDAIAELPFVVEVKRVHVAKSPDKDITFERLPISKKNTSESCDNAYGPSYRQIEMIAGHLLHEMDYRGEGMDIAVFDAGWANADKLPAFDALRNEGRLKMTRDFVFGTSGSVYNLNNHGTYVLSLMTGFIPDSLIGTAPQANYFLFRTEDPTSEYPVEEDNWVAAAELADSLGIDVINSSLGYSLFDDPNLNHTYQDMNGNTTHCSIAADIAAAKGILVVNSAGNSGDNPWHYITAPSDGDSVLCVGAVKADGTHAPFSSFGPSSDGDVKPNVSAMGFAAVIADMDSTIRVGNGTSFSSPILAGMTACLRQAFPDVPHMQVFRAIEQSAHLYNTPNDSLGYGIPNFFTAFQILQGRTWQEEGPLELTLFPNPCVNTLQVSLTAQEACDVQYRIYDTQGRIVADDRASAGYAGRVVIHLEKWLSTLRAGVYTIQVETPDSKDEIRFVKTDN